MIAMNVQLFTPPNSATEDPLTTTFITFRVEKEEKFQEVKVASVTIVNCCLALERYLKGTPNLGFWYPKGSCFDLKAYSDSDYAGCNLDRKIPQKQSFVTMSSAEAEYVVTAGCCAQVLWIKSQLADYDVLYDKVPIFCDNTSAIAISF
ncbi:hypothetical protein Tco_1240611 [Tanacetum coccineum]